MRGFAIGLLASALVVGVASAQAPGAPQVSGAQQPGARAGNSYVPSTHTPGCGGVLCDGNDPQIAAAPPPPCQGLLCGVSPYSMQRPVTAAEAARMQEERARAEAAAAAAPPPAPEKRTRVRKARAKAPKAAVAARTPAPVEPAPAAR